MVPANHVTPQCMQTTSMTRLPTRFLKFSSNLARQADMMVQGRTAYMSLDMCSAHSCALEGRVKQDNPKMKVVSIPHVWPIHLPPNFISTLHPADRGLDYSLKVQCRRWYMRWLLTQTLLNPGVTDHISRMNPDLRTCTVCLAGGVGRSLTRYY